MRQTRTRHLQPTLIALIFLVFPAFSEALWAADTADPMRPEALYGSDLSFSIWRDGDQIGAHKTKFYRNGEDLIVETSVDMRVKVLFITAYSMDHTIKETWRDGALHHLSVWTDDDGDISEFTARRNGEKIIVEGPDGRYDAPTSLMTTSHWNRWILDRNLVFNTLTGHLNTIALSKKGDVTVAAGTSERKATHYAYTGELDTDIWFDDMGRWVKLKFKAPDGSDIEYICEACGVSKKCETCGASKN